MTSQQGLGLLSERGRGSVADRPADSGLNAPALIGFLLYGVQNRTL